ncbi:uncharacterized protein V1516DRAFT_118861 [Lipomyces oligophaga]|uniref:uncharacterized protein n=1 Tax=Lipomyces oligophaga TaxID=45792 RepID=UPI0034CF5B91
MDISPIPIQRRDSTFLDVDVSQFPQVSQVPQDSQVSPASILPTDPNSVDTVFDDYATLSPDSSAEGDLDLDTTISVLSDASPAPQSSTTTLSSESLSRMTSASSNDRPSVLLSSSSNANLKLASSSTDSTFASSSLTSAQKRSLTRKSTLTQQQKNNRRQRATAPQLIILESEFSVNPAPNTKTRLRIADQINMTERSVQIWFQNRRAKIKVLARKSIETGEDTDHIPESMKQYLALQNTGPGSTNSSAFFAQAFGFSGTRAPGLSRSASFSGMTDRAFANSSVSDYDYSTPPLPAQKMVVSRFSCSALSIGTWRRIGSSNMDLVVFFSPSQSRFTYYINNDCQGFKIEFLFSDIKRIYLEPIQTLSDSQSKAQSQPDSKVAETAEIIIQLSRIPQFYLESTQGDGGWFETEDFTEDQQASKVLEHKLAGSKADLELQLSEFLSVQTASEFDSTRIARTPSSSSLSTNTSSISTAAKMLNSFSFTSSAPVSPLVTNAPAFTAAGLATVSAPLSTSTFVGPTVGGLSRPALTTGGSIGGEVSMFGAEHLAPPKLTHRRTRSRSVPAAMDFNFFDGMGLNPNFGFPPSAMTGAERGTSGPVSGGMVPLAPSQLHVTMTASPGTEQLVLPMTYDGNAEQQLAHTPLPQTSTTSSLSNNRSLRIDTAVGGQYMDEEFAFTAPPVLVAPSLGTAGAESYQSVPQAIAVGSMLGSGEDVIGSSYGDTVAANIWMPTDTGYRGDLGQNGLMTDGTGELFPETFSNETMIGEETLASSNELGMTEFANESLTDTDQLVGAGMIGLQRIPM